MKTLPYRLYEVPDDFEAGIRIFTEEQGGRKTAPFNGIRWDFAYDGDDIQTDGLFMIWPDFHDTSNDSLPRDKPLPLDEILLARMTIVSDEMRDEPHKRRIEVGTRFYCHVGNKRVAAGSVTRITGLHVPRPFRK